MGSVWIHINTFICMPRHLVSTISLIKWDKLQQLKFMIWYLEFILCQNVALNLYHFIFVYIKKSKLTKLYDLSPVDTYCWKATKRASKSVFLLSCLSSIKFYVETVICVFFVLTAQSLPVSPVGNAMKDPTAQAHHGVTWRFPKWDALTSIKLCNDNYTPFHLILD